MMNKIGYGTQEISLFQLVNSTQMMLVERQSAQLSDEQRSEIDKNIIIAWSVLLEPILVLIFYNHYY